jgi:hypothetical protein
MAIQAKVVATSNPERAQTINFSRRAAAAARLRRISFFVMRSVFLTVIEDILTGNWRGRLAIAYKGREFQAAFGPFSADLQAGRMLESGPCDYLAD